MSTITYMVRMRPEATIEEGPIAGKVVFLCAEAAANLVAELLDIPEARNEALSQLAGDIENRLSVLDDAILDAAERVRASRERDAGRLPGDAEP